MRSFKLFQGYKFFIGLSILVLAVQIYLGFFLYAVNDSENYESFSSNSNNRHQHRKLYVNHKHLFNYSSAAVAKRENGDQSFLFQSPGWDPDAARNKELEKRFFYKKVDCGDLTLDALSALKRARTNECKQSIAHVHCLLENNQLFPKHLPRYCPLKGSGHGTFMGCFQDSKANRDLSGPQQVIPDNSPEKCVDLCYASGYNYAGVQYGKECWCGDAYGKLGALSNSSCDMPCPGDKLYRCGGYNAQGIYKTGFGLRPSNSEENPAAPAVLDVETSHMVRILFMLTWNGRALRQVKRLFKAIYHVNHYYYIHVDARQDYLYRELVYLAQNYANVRVVEKRTATIWGGASLLEMLTQTMKEALAMKDWHWDFYLNLSESDYPVKSLEKLTAFLTANRDKNFLKSHGPDTPMFMRKQALLRTFYECDTHLWRIGNRTVPTGIRIDGGSDWICLNRKFVKYVTATDDELVKGLREYFKYSLLGAESFFHTVLQNSEYCETFVDNNLHRTNWNRKRGCLCQYKHIVDWCGCSPLDYSAKDLDKLKKTESTNIYFARKFEAIVSNAIVNNIDEWLHGPYSSGVPALDMYWQNVWHYAERPSLAKDADYTYYMAFSQNGIKQLLKVEEFSTKCAFNVDVIRQVHVLNEKDNFSGLLIEFNAIHSSGEVTQLEAYLKPSLQLHKWKPIGDASRLRTISVGANFDVKERIFRDYGQLLNPNPKNLTAVHIWEGGNEFLVTVLFVDPLGHLASVNEHQIPTGMDNLVMTVPELPKPLLPGVWCVKLVLSRTVAAEKHFLILPQLYKNGKPNVSAKPATVTYSSITKEQLASYGSLVTEEDKKYQDEKHLYNILNSDFVTLSKWVSEQVAKFWSPEGVCVFASSSHCSIIPQCKTTAWSSASPDPKSDIGAINPHTGRINRSHRI